MEGQTPVCHEPHAINVDCHWTPVENSRTIRGVWILPWQIAAVPNGQIYGWDRAEAVIVAKIHMTADEVDTDADCIKTAFLSDDVNRIELMRYLDQIDVADRLVLLGVKPVASKRSASLIRL
jgi:hypothetical protein